MTKIKIPKIVADNIADIKVDKVYYNENKKKIGRDVTIYYRDEYNELDYIYRFIECFDVEIGGSLYEL